MRTIRLAILTAAAAAGLSACTSAQAPLAPDFGQALRQNLTAQIADPDARYRRDVDPASNGARTSAAQVRYQKGLVTPVQGSATTSIRSQGGGAPSGN